MSSRRTERGQSTVEYAGALLLVGLIVAALLTLVPSIRGTLVHAVTCVIPSGDCTAAGSTTSGGAAEASNPGSGGASEPAANPVPVPTPAPAPTPNVANTWTGQAANLPQGGSRPYVPPKKSHGKPHRVRGDRGTGYEDVDGNVWVWDPRGHAGPHWDVQHPDGSHTNVYPDGEIHQGADNFPNKPRGNSSSGSGDDGGGGDDHTAEIVGGGAAVIGGGGLLWWLGKAASPACGPAVLVCAVVL
jgi:hypothetical protein